jgi:GntR family transcriptional regulator
MFIRIETSSGLPISRQIADQIRSQCVSGALLPGDRLPSVRQLARELAVNPNTIHHVYERLTAEALLERRQGDGTYVSANLPPGRSRAQRDLLEKELDRIAHRALDLDLMPQELRELLNEAISRAQRQRPIVKKG